MSSDSVFVDFQVGGIREVQKAFESVEQAMLKAERTSYLTTKRATDARLKEYKRDQAGRFKAEAEWQKEFTRATSAQTSHAKAHADARIAIAQREAEKKKAAEAGMLADLDAIKDRYAEADKRRMAQLASEEKRRLKEEESAHKASMQRRQQFARTVTGAAGNSIRGMANTAANWGGAALTLGGALTVGSAAQRAMSCGTASVALANSMFNPSDPEQAKWLKSRGMQRFDPKQLLSSAGVVSAQSGLDKADVLKGWQSYVALSSDWQALADPKQLAQVSKLSMLAKSQGADFGQVMDAAGSMRMQNPNLSADKMWSMMLSVVAQGKAGAVEFKDLAQHGSTITASAGQYGMKQEDAQAALLGLAQIARRAAGDPAIAATSVARFAADVSTHAKKAMAAHPGYDPIADKKTGALKTPSEILAMMFDVTKGNTSMFQGTKDGHLGLGLESVHVAQGEVGVYRAAVETAKAGGANETVAHKAGVEAVRKDAQRYERASYNEADVLRDQALVMATSAERFASTIRELNSKLEVRLLPFIEKLATALEKNAPEIDKFMDALARVADWLSENPWSGLGAVIAAKLTADITGAGVGAAASAAVDILIKNSFAKAGAESAGLGGAGLGVAGLALAVTTLSVAAATVDVLNILDWAKAGQDAGDQAADDMKSDDPIRQAAAVASLRDAHGKTGAVDQANVWLDGIARFAALATANPASVATWGLQNGSEQLLDAKGLQGGHRRALETIKAKDLIDQYDIRMTLSRAIKGGIADGVAAITDPNHPHRTGPMTAPARGGTGSGK